MRRPVVVCVVCAMMAALTGGGLVANTLATDAGATGPALTRLRLDAKVDPPPAGELIVLVGCAWQGL